MLPKSVVLKLISGLKCSNCFKSFDEDSIHIMRFDDGLFVLKITCQKCLKSFALAFLGLDEREIVHSASLGGREAGPITFDDVLDAHNYIQNLDENWKNFIQNIDTHKKHQ